MLIVIYGRDFYYSNISSENVINHPMTNLTNRGRIPLLLGFCWLLVAAISRMKMSSNRNFFRVTGHLCDEFTGHKGQWRRALMSSLICPRINGWENNGETGGLRRNGAHYGVTVMWYLSHPIGCMNRGSITWLIMQSLLASSDHQQSWYWSI